MDALEGQQRAAVVKEALSWKGTPYHHEARAKGAGVDCAQLLAAVFINCGLIAPPVIERYPPDWHFNSADERLLRIVTRFAGEIEGTPLPGDVVVWRFAKCFAHGAIVLDWPQVIHSLKPRRVTIDDAERAGWLQTIFEVRELYGQPRPRRIFSYWAPRP